MHISTTVISVLLAVLVLCTQVFAIPAVDAKPKGLNCKGSGRCVAYHKGNIDDSIVLAQSVSDDKIFKNHEYIACLGNNLNGHLCAFPQHTRDGLSGYKAKTLLQTLQGNVCRKCGSVPINYPDTNNVLDGMLTVNFILRLEPEAVAELDANYKELKVNNVELKARAPSAQGINCKGSFFCRAHPKNLDNIIHKAQFVDDGKIFKNNERVACVGNILSAYLCAFPQKTAHGITGQRAKALLMMLHDNHCNKCGRIPEDYPNSNNLDNGMLKVDYVQHQDPMADTDVEADDD